MVWKVRLSDCSNVHEDIESCQNESLPPPLTAKEWDIMFDAKAQFLKKT